MKRYSCLTVLTSWIALGVTSAAQAADNSGSGTIEGRVLNASSGAYLKNVKITVKGATIEAFTDENGEYRLTGVPAGDVPITAFHTGLLPQVSTAKVTAGSTAVLDFSLARSQPTAEGDPLKLDAFVVATNREFNAQAIAINEQRFAPNIKNVVSTDEFGDIGEANIGEFIKLMPGVSVNYNGGIFADQVSVRGFPSYTTGVTVDGGQPANAGTGGIQREFDLNVMQMLNNIARVEVAKTPTPDLPASMLGGSVNLVPKSAFERAHPVFSYRVSGTGNSRHLGGSYPSFMGEERINTIRPAGEFGYIVPVSKTFGFTLSAASNPRFVVFDNGTSTWDLVRSVLTNYSVATSVQRREAVSWGATADWKVAENHVLSGSLNFAGSHVRSPRTSFALALGANPTGDATFAQSNGFVGSVTNTPSTNADRLEQTWYGGLKYRHTGKVWRTDASATYSSSTSKARYVDKAAFFSLSAALTNVAVRFDDISGGGHPGPARITGTTAAGPVNVWDAANFRLTTATDGRRTVHATKDGAQINTARYVDLFVPVQIKTGLYINRDIQDNRTPAKSWTFLGRDGIANNDDNRAGNYDFIAEQFSSEPLPYGFPKMQTLSPYKVLDYYRANPSQFLLNDVAYIQSRATNSTKMSETISAAYVRGDVKLVGNRLLLVGGVRFERTQDEGYGPLNDLKATLRQDSNGNLLRDAAGRTIPVTTDPVQRALLQFKERGAYAKRSYDGYYPSFNGSYNISDTVVARVAYARTIGRPQYVNIVPGTTITDPDVLNPTITIRNTGLNPWTANAYDLSLEKYFANNGVASIGVFRKEIQDFFGAVRTPATPGMLAELGLSDDYDNYDIVSTLNVGSARISGMELNFRQALTYLPSWARGVQLFANGTFNKLEGDRDADFTGFATRIVNWGVSLNRARFSVKLNWNASDDRRGGRVVANASTPENTYNWTADRTTLDGSFEIRLHRHLAIFGTARNLTNSPVRSERYAPATPAFARPTSYIVNGVFLSLGLKGEF